MKKLFFIFVLLFSISIAKAEVFKYNAYQGRVYYEGIWTNWDNCDISIRVINNVVKVYNPIVQNYKIITEMVEYNYYNRTEYICNALDNNNIKVKLSFKIINNGLIQLWIEYSNTKIIYNIIIDE